MNYPSTLTHIDEKGAARMVDVGGKDVSLRMAVALCRVEVSSRVIKLIRDGKVPKGDVFATARIAGIMASKKVDQLIPLCHTLALTSAEIKFRMEEGSILIRATVKTEGKTGVEMEALTAASVSALTVYDMCKAVDRGLVINSVRLVEKRGGKSGTFRCDQKIYEEIMGASGWQ